MKASDMAAACGLPPRLAYSVKDTARYTGLSYYTIREEMRAGRLAYVIPRGHVRGYMIRPSAIDDWIKENTHAMEA